MYRVVKRDGRIVDFEISKIANAMKKTALRKAAGISSSSLAKLGKDENVTTDVLLRICKALDCELDDIVEIERTEE